jgi:hypothetical protein
MWDKVLCYDISEDAALKDIFGIDIMRDNVDLSRKGLGGRTIIMSLLMIKIFSQNATLDHFFS